MRIQVILRTIGYIALLNAFFLFICTLISWHYHDSALLSLSYSAIISLLLGIFPLIYVPLPENISNNEGLFIVVSGWLLSCLLGILPYLLWGGEFSLANAWFESASGFTTTGATILTDVEALPKSILFWRASTHWIGGVGILIFTLALIPSRGFSSSLVFRRELSTLAADNFQARAVTTVRIIMIVYLGLTMAESVLLKIAGMSWFDAVSHSFATIATGGFSTKNLSIAWFGSWKVELIISLFMLLSGMHFGLIFYLFTKLNREIFKNVVVHYYIILLLAAISISSIELYGKVYHNWVTSLRFASFQILSVGTSTGFATADSSHWPGVSRLMIIFFTLLCACSGSTSGGIKIDRFVVLIKFFLRQCRQLLHPKAIISIYFGRKSLDEDFGISALLFIVIYLLICFVGSLLLCAGGTDILTAFSGVIACMGNVGPGFGSVGSLDNYGHLSNFAKYTLSFIMILGRLEIYGFLIFFTLPWKITSTSGFQIKQ